jgi:histidinol-phosphate phosphatase family protein
MKIEAVFIDRDGTLGGTGHFIHPKDFSIYPFTLKALQILKNNDIKIYACTNQHRISKGEATIQDFKREFQLLGFDDAFICPHSMDSNCLCKKPQTGMLLEASQKYNIDLKKSVFIGDVGATDMLAAHNVGAIKILVCTGWGRSSLDEYRDSWKHVNADYIAENLLEAVQWVISKYNV